MRFLARIFAFIGFSVVLSVVLGVVSFFMWRPETPELPARMVLQLDFTKPVPELPSGNPVASLLGENELNLRQIVNAIDRATKDERVQALFADLSEVALAPAQLEEVRAAVARFRAAGKFSLAYADSYGELGPGNKQYWLASAFEQVWLQPLGSVGLTGPAATIPFFRGMLDKLGVIPDFF
jgi:protease IV